MIYLKLFLTFLMIGAFTFGGGYAMLPLIATAVITTAQAAFAITPDLSFIDFSGKNSKKMVIFSKEVDA